MDSSSKGKARQKLEDRVSLLKGKCLAYASVIEEYERTFEDGENTAESFARVMEFALHGAASAKNAVLLAEPDWKSGYEFIDGDLAAWLEE